MQQPYVLWLPSWYPNKLAPYEGDFIQRHALAAAICQKIVVLVLVHDSKGEVTKSIEVETKEEHNLLQVLVYYHIRVSLLQPILKASSFLMRMFLYRKYVNQILNKSGLPRMVHVHVAGNAGVAALWLCRKYGLRLLVSEHWGGYLNGGNAGYKKLPWYKRRLLQKMYKGADATSAVSLSLAQNLQALFHIPDCRIIPNVVDTSLFRPATKTAEHQLQFIHISTLDYPKNVPAIIAGFGMFYQTTGIDFLLTIIGPPHAQLQAWCMQHGVADRVIWQPERPQALLVPLLQQSDALVLFSIYETFGCVLIEANACGVPALVSNVSVFKEIIVDGFNGLIADGTSAADLCSLLQQFVQQKDRFSAEAISRHTADKYNYQQAGRLFEDWYAGVQNACLHANK